MYGWFSSVHSWHLKNQRAKDPANFNEQMGSQKSNRSTFLPLFSSQEGFFLVVQILGNTTLALVTLPFQLWVIKNQHHRLHLSPCRLRHPASGGQLQCKLRATLHRYGEPRGRSFQSVEKRKKQPTAMFKKKNIWMIDIYNHIHQVTCCFCFILLIVLSKKNRGGSTTATCPDRILGLIPVAVSCLFPESLWSSFAWCVSEFFFQMDDCFRIQGRVGKANI